MDQNRRLTSCVYKELYKKKNWVDGCVNQDRKQNILGIEVVRYNELNFRPEVCGTIDLIRETLELEMQI